jgi:hypothetical protein
MCATVARPVVGCDFVGAAAAVVAQNDKVVADVILTCEHASQTRLKILIVLFERKRRRKLRSNFRRSGVSL